MSLHNAPAVVTGAGRGIGRTIAIELAKVGHPVALQSRTIEQLNETKALIEAAGGQAVCVPGDVTDAAASETLIEKCTEAFGIPKIAVAGAGQAISAPLKRTSVEQLRQLFEVNTVSAFHLIKSSSERMIKAGEGGRIVVVASTAATRGMSYTAAYSASKHAVLGLVRSAAHELASKKITVNALCPGWVDTPMFDYTLKNISEKTGCSLEEARAKIEKNIPLGRVLETEEVAATLMYMVSDAAGKMTGQAVVIDGGESL
ncbi:MAG: SDR family NAD(P)-dependent oxidoreductase [Myxococcota bacterium]|nr:SDR family NAD(P)-dependent oxidoreductase [Myxococcota bacterium]